MKTKLNYSTFDEDYFNGVADRLLNECYLLVNGKKFRFVEIEFYLNSNRHPDPYVHGDPDQLLMNTFYFHKFGTGTYKSGTFKGMDLTFGSEKHAAYFGILIRALQDVETGLVIEGPCNCVNRILAEYKCDSIMSFTGGNSLNIYENDHNFILEIDEDLEKKEIFAGPRIGLSAKFPAYHKRNYRYVIFKDRIKKSKTSLVRI